MYSPKVTAQHLRRMDLMYRNDTGNKNVNLCKQIKSIDGELFHQGYFFFPESIISADSG